MGVRAITALSGIVAVVTTIAVVALYFTHMGPPPMENVLTRTLLGLGTFSSFMLFMAGLHALLRREGSAGDFALLLSQTAGILFVGMGLIAMANEAGVAFGAPDGSMDPTTDGPLAAANILIHGSIQRLLTATYLFAIGYAVFQTSLIPRWIGALGFVIGAVNVGFIPALFFGTDVTRFYSAHGWGNSALAGSLIIWWILAVSLALLGRRSATRSCQAEVAPG